MPLLRALLIALIAMWHGAAPAWADVLRVGYSHFPPFSISSDSGDPTGYSPAVLNALAQTEGWELEFVTFNNPGASLAALARGDVDVVPNLARTPEREEIGRYTRPFAAIEFSLYALRGQPPSGLSEIPFSTSVGYVEGAFTAALVVDLDVATKVAFPTNEAMLLALASGEVNSAIFPNFTIRQMSAWLGIENRFVAVGEPLRMVQSHIVVRPDQPDLHARIDQGLARLADDGVLHDLSVAWLAASPAVTISPENLRNLKIGLAVFVILILLAVASIWIRGRNRLLLAALSRAEVESRFALQLRTLNAELRKKNEDMENVLYVVSHDLKSPLVSIAGFCERIDAVLSANKNQDGLRALARVTRNVEIMNILIDGIMRVSRIGGVSLQIETVSMADIISDVRSTLYGDLLAAGAALNAHSEVTVRTDPIMLRQIVQNIVANAIRHGCPEPDMTIEMTVSRTDNGVRIAVHDAGPGIDKAFEERIFEMFQTLSASEKGSGLGLAIARKTATSLGGSVTVDTSVEKGALFVIEIPDLSPKAKHHEQDEHERAAA